MSSFPWPSSSYSRQWHNSEVHSENVWIPSKDILSSFWHRMVLHLPREHGPASIQSTICIDSWRIFISWSYTPVIDSNQTMGKIHSSLTTLRNMHLMSHYTVWLPPWLKTHQWAITSASSHCLSSTHCQIFFISLFDASPVCTYLRIYNSAWLCISSCTDNIELTLSNQQ